MKRMYTKLLGGVMLGATFVAGASAEATKSVVLVSTDGTQRQEVLANVDRIELGSESLILKIMGGATETLDYKDIDRILIGAEYSAVKEIAASDEIAVWPTVTTDVVNISGLAKGEAVSVVGLNGTASVKASVIDVVTTINLKDLPAGVYVVTAKKQSVKIIKK